jgi:hypothetical protein
MTEITKKIKITGNHIMIIFKEKKEIKLMNTKDLKWMII